MCGSVAPTSPRRASSMRHPAALQVPPHHGVLQAQPSNRFPGPPKPTAHHVRPRRAPFAFSPTNTLTRPVARHHPATSPRKPCWSQGLTPQAPLPPSPHRPTPQAMTTPTPPTPVPCHRVLQYGAPRRRASLAAPHTSSSLPQYVATVPHPLVSCI